MNFRGEQKREELTLNITPLIDVVFLLLIFFMLTTTFAKEKTIDINLPKTVDAATEPDQRSIELSIDAAGQYYLNQQRLAGNDRQSLTRALAASAAATQKPIASIPVRLLGDAKTPHQNVVTALDVMGKLGFTKVQISTDNRVSS